MDKAKGGQIGGRKKIDGCRARPSNPPPPTLSELGISKTQSSRWQQTAALSEAAFERKVERATNKSVDTGIFYEPRTVEWWTPREYIDMAREVMGDIDLDPASCAEANKIVGAAQFYDVQTDGLKQSWHGRVWLNPPYAESAGQFAEKLLAEKAGGNVAEAIILLATNTLDRGWFAPLWNGVLCFHRGRVKFTSPDIDATSPPMGSVFIYLGRKEKRFADVFSKVGAIVKRWP
jgi:hypothetical protein